MSRVPLLNGGGRQGWATDAVPSATPRLDAGALKDFFGGDVAIMDPRFNVPITSKTLEDGYYLNDPKLTKFLVQASVNGEGWPMTFAPLQVMAMNQRIDILEWQLSAAKPTPEGAVTDLVQYQESSITTKMIRAGLGAEMKADFMNRPEGKEIFAQAVQQVASGFWLLVKLQVADKVLNAKQYWHIWASENGLPSSTIIDASRKERELFGALQKLPKGLYTVHHEASQILSLGNVVPNMIVLPDNTFNMLALAPFETESFRRGEATVNTRLALGGKSMMSIFPGVTMFEDPIYRANNLPANEISPFIRTTMTGEYFLLNAEYYDPKCDDSCSDRQVSTQVVDLAKDRWVTLSLRDIVEGNLDMRWDPRTGELSDYHDRMLDNLQSIANTLGIKDPGHDVDPFIWTSQDGNYFKARFWGDVNKTFLSMDRIENMAAALVRKTRTEFSESDFQSISSLLHLSEELSNPVEIASDLNVQGLFAAISFLNGRAAGAAESGYLNANSYGVPDLPQMPAAPANVAAAAPEGIVRVTRATARAGQTGFSVWSYRPQVGAAATARTIFYFVPDASTQTNAQLVQALTAAQPGSFSPVKLPARPYGYGSLPGLRYLASLARQANPAYAAWKDLFSLAEKGVNAFEKFSRVFQRVFPKTPLSEISNLPDFAKSGRDDFDRSTMIWLSVVAKSQYPFHVRVWQEHTEGIKADEKDLNVSWVSSIQYVNTGDPNNALDIPIIRAKAGEVAGTQFSMVNIGKQDGDIGRISKGNAAVFLQSMNDLLGENNCPEVFKRALSNAKSYDETNKKFVQVFGNLLQRLYREDLNDRVADNSPVAGLELLTFFYALFWNNRSIPVLPGESTQQTIQRRLQFYKAIAVMIETGKHPFTRDLRLEDIRKLLENTQLSSNADLTVPSVITLNEEAKEPANTSLITNRSAWTNSRLILHQDVWKTLLNADRSSYLQGDIVRPSNPVNPRVPLLGEFAIRDTGALNDNNLKLLKENVELFARASNDMRRRCDPAVQAFSMYHSSWYDSSEAKDVQNRIRELTNVTEAFRNQEVSTFLAQSLRDITLYDVAQTQTGAFSSSSSSSGSNPTRLLTQREYLIWRLSQLENVTSNTHVRWFARGLLFAYVHRESVLALLREGVAPWFSSFLIYRPFIQQDMGTGLWAQGGNQTAITGYNYGAATLQLDALHDRWTYKYTTWITCEIVDETRLHLMHDIVFKRYIAGRDTVVYTDPSLFQSGNPDLCKASLFVLNMGGELMREQLPNPLSLTGVLSQHDFPFNITNADVKFARSRLQLPTYYYINLWRWHELNANRPLIDRYSFAAQKRASRINEVMWSGDQKYYNTAEKKYSEKYIGTSHWSGMEPPLLSVVNGSTLYANSLLRSSVIKD